MVKLDRKYILEKLEKIEEKEQKIKFLDETIKKIKDEELKKELQSLLEEIKNPTIDEIVREERFSTIELKTPQIKPENLEQTIKEEPIIKKEETKERKYKQTIDYGIKKTTYEDTKIESPFFDQLKTRLDRAGLMPSNMIFTEKNVRDIKIYMSAMKIPEDKIEKYIDRIADIKNSLYEAKEKKLGMFNVEYERE